MVSTTTEVPGEASTICGIASRLEPPGILRSSTRTVGLCPSEYRFAASTSPASATTSMSGSASSSMRRPLRTTEWSSARTMVMLSVSGVTATGVSGRRGVAQLSRSPHRSRCYARMPPRRPPSILSEDTKGGSMAPNPNNESLMEETGLGLLPGIVIALGLVVGAMALLLLGSMIAVFGVLALVVLVTVAILAVVVALLDEEGDLGRR